MFEMRLVGIEQIIRNIDLLESSMFLEFKKSADEISEAIAQALRDKIEEKGLVETGALRDSVSFSVEMLPGFQILSEIEINVPYAEIHEYGGVVEAKNGMMTFQLKDGSWRKAEKVIMPANPFMQPVLYEVEAIMERIILKNLALGLF